MTFPVFFVVTVFVVVLLAVIMMIYLQVYKRYVNREFNSDNAHSTMVPPKNVIALTVIVLFFGILLSLFVVHKIGNTETNEVQWEYTPLLSSRYPAMPFSFNVSCEKIVVTCDNGTLIDFDHFDDASKSYPQGTSLTIQNAGKLYWAPYEQEEDTAAASAEVTFTVLDENGKTLYEGILVIMRMEEITFGAVYTAILKDGSGLTLTQHEDQLGGILT